MENRIPQFNACNSKYALCTSAKCIDNDDGSLSCTCDIYDGLNISEGIACDDLKPYTANGINYIFSTYSGINQNDLVQQNCPNGNVWG